MTYRCRAVRKLRQRNDQAPYQKMCISQAFYCLISGFPNPASKAALRDRCSQSGYGSHFADPCRANPCARPIAGMSHTQIDANSIISVACMVLRAQLMHGRDQRPCMLGRSELRYAVPQIEHVARSMPV